MARQTLDLVDPRIAKALSHPMRARILGILNEKVASPNEIAEEIEERLPNVSYHVRALVDLGCIELVSMAQRRGAIERPFFSDRDWKRLPRSGRAAISDVALQIIWEDVSEAIEGGTFEGRSDRHLSHQALELDEEGWRDMTRLLAGVLAEVERIGTASAARLTRSGDEGISTKAVLMHFETPSTDAQQS